MFSSDCVTTSLLPVRCNYMRNSCKWKQLHLFIAEHSESFSKSLWNRVNIQIRKTAATDHYESATHNEITKATCFIFFAKKPVRPRRLQLTTMSAKEMIHYWRSIAFDFYSLQKLPSVSGTKPQVEVMIKRTSVEWYGTNIYMIKLLLGNIPWQYASRN